MTTALMPEARQRYYNNDGTVAAGCLLYTYAAGTTTPKATYQDAAGTTPHANPIILDGKGEAVIYWDGAYKVDLKTADGVQITGYPVDNYTPPVDTLRTDLAASSGASLIGYLPVGASAVATTLESKAREIRSLFDWLTEAQQSLVVARTGYNAASRSEMYSALVNAWADAQTGNFDLYAPEGLYEIGANNFPFRNTSSSSLLDVENLTLWCAGPGTVFRTVSTNGADVFQVNALKNFHVRGFPTLEATISGTTAGSNGVSITNGGDNLTFEIRGYNLPSLDKTSYVDGGKAFTIQPSTSSNEVGTIKATVYAVGCAAGFGYDLDLVTAAGKKTSISVDLVAEDCYQAVRIAAGAATGALTDAMTLGVTVRGHAINCQQDVVLGRVHGCDVDLHLITTKTAAARRLGPNAVAWRATDTVVEALQCAYAYNARIDLRGNKGECDYKARIGGATAGSSGLVGATKDCSITLDIGGTAATADVLEINSGGNTMRNSLLTASVRTCTSLPDAFYTASLANYLRIGAINTGSYTGTLTGCTTSPTGTIEWSLTGDVVTLQIPTISGTSNSTSATITGMPASIRPSTASSGIGITVDSGTAAIGRIVVETTGTITLYNSVTAAGFTAAGTKGIQFSTITYRRG